MRDHGISEKERFEHILRAIEEIQVFTKGYSKASYLNDRILINATLFQFAIIGEAIMRISNARLAKFAYPWHKVRGFRNFILHEYHAIEFRVVWQAIKKDLPELKKMIVLILAKEL